MEDIFLKQITLDEVADIESMARRIWPKAYSEIISSEQIDFMLGWMYSPEKIAAEITDGGIGYFWIESGAEKVGFLAVGPIQPNKRAFLHKCYLLNEKHGCGIGSRALGLAFDLLSDARVTDLELRVNRENSAAVSFYEKNGFRIVAEDVAEIGNGFVMDDLIMRRAV